MFLLGGCYVFRRRRKDLDGCSRLQKECGAGMLKFLCLSIIAPGGDTYPHLWRHLSISISVLRTGISDLFKLFFLLLIGRLTSDKNRQKGNSDLVKTIIIVNIFLYEKCSYQAHEHSMSSPSAIVLTHCKAVLHALQK